MGIIIKNKELDVRGLVIQNFKEEPKFALKANDGKKRPLTWVRGIVLHTTRGIPGGHDRRAQTIKPGNGPDHKRDEKVALMWSLDTRNAGAHLIVDSDGSWVNTCDLQDFAAYHAGNVNVVTIGIEMYQEPDGSLYEGQLRSTIKMIDFLTKTFGIQRQVCWPYHGHAIRRGLRYGTDMIGIYGHRDCSNNRGSGDPGDAIMQWLGNYGYEMFDFSEDEDKDTWSARQKSLNLLPDGIPGPATVTALLQAGYPHGLWISRPGDD